MPLLCHEGSYVKEAWAGLMHQFGSYFQERLTQKH